MERERVHDVEDRDSWGHLLPELVALIMGHLDLRNGLVCMRLNRHWNTAVRTQRWVSRERDYRDHFDHNSFRQVVEKNEAAVHMKLQHGSLAFWNDVLLIHVDAMAKHDESILSLVMHQVSLRLSMILNGYIRVPDAHLQILFETACWIGNTDVISSLLANERVDPGTNDNWVIRHAAMRGHTETVKLLLADKRVDPSAKNSWVIRHAAESGHTETVELLLADERVDPAASNNYAIRAAAMNGHTATVELLVTDGRVDPALLNPMAGLPNLYRGSAGFTMFPSGYLRGDG